MSKQSQTTKRPLSVPAGSPSTNGRYGEGVLNRQLDLWHAQV
jgi:hypothetical protein